MEAFMVTIETAGKNVGRCIIAEDINDLCNKHPTAFVLNAFTFGGLGLEFIAGKEGSDHRALLEIFLGMAYFGNSRITESSKNGMKAFMVNYRSDRMGVGGCEIAKDETELRVKRPNAFIYKTLVGIESIAGKDGSDHRALLEMILGMAYFANSTITGPPCYETSWHRDARIGKVYPKSGEIV